MMRSLYICLTLLLLTACNGNKNRFTLSARIEGLNDTIALALLPDTAFGRIDTIRIEKGVFDYQLTTDTTTQVTLCFSEGRQLTVFAERGVESSIEGQSDTWDLLEAQGGQANNELAAFRRTNRHTSPAALRDSVMQFIDRYPFSPVGAHLINIYFAQQPQPDAKLIEELIGHMAGKLQDNLLVQDIQQHLADLQKADSGKYISSFRIKNVKGKYINAYQYNNQYQVFGFWAAWHPGSIQDQKRLVRLAGKYKKEPVAFINVSLDMDKKQWKDTVENDTITAGEQCNEPGGWDGRTAKQFAVTRLPQYILLNKQRRLVARTQSLDSILHKLDECLLDDPRKAKEKRK